jgi:hypothetical protein
VANLGSLNKFSEALIYVEYFSFSLVNRLFSIENIRPKYLRNNTYGVNKMIFKNS